MSRIAAQSALWIGGWASDVACWEPEIAAAFPDHTHSFLDAMEYLDRPEELAKAIGHAASDGVVLAWSLGSLLAHELLEGGSWPAGVRLISLCPVFDFCRPGRGWRPGVIARMRRRLAEDRFAVISDFAMRLGVPDAMRERWLAAAGRHELAVLDRGLEVLATRRAQPRAAPFVRLVAGEDDPIAPIDAQEIAGFRIAWYARGHAPFLTDPACIQASLLGDQA